MNVSSQRFDKVNPCEYKAEYLNTVHNSRNGTPLAQHVMSYKIRDIHRPASSEHPELLSRSERIWLFAEEHRSALIIGVLLVCLVAVAIGAIFWLQHQNEQEAFILEHRAAQLYLDRSLDDQGKAHLEEAITLYQQILDEFPGTSSAELAWYFLGNAHTEQENYTGAIEDYENYISSFQNNPTLLGLVFQRLGSAYIFNGQRQKGLDTYTQVLNLPDALNKDQVLFELAKLEEAENHTEQALTYYKQLQDHYPASPYINEATMHIRVLEPPQEPSEDTPGEDPTTAPEDQSTKETEE